MIMPFRRVIYAFLDRILGLPGIRKLLGPLLRVDYTIRHVDPSEDLDALAACGATLSASLPEAIRRDFRLEIAKDKAGRVLGFVRAMRQGLEQDWWIVGLGVRPLFRRRGIGEALVNEVLVNLREGGVSQVHLEVNRASLPAIALYRKLGFKEMPDSERTGDGDFLQMIKTS